VEASARADRDGTSFNQEYRIIAKDGRIVWVRDEAWAVASDAKMSEYRIVRIALKDKSPFPVIPGGVGGKFAGEQMGVILVSTTDEASLRRTLDASPAVKAGASYDIIPLYMSDGILSGAVR